MKCSQNFIVNQNVPPHCLPLDEGACTEGNDGQTQSYSSPQKVTSIDFFIDRGILKPGCSWRSSPTAANRSCSDRCKRLNSNMKNLYLHSNTWCEEGWSGRRGHPQAPSPQICACNQTSWPSPPDQLLYK